MSSVSVTGTDATVYSLDVLAEITTDEEAQGSALLERLALHRDGGTLRLKTPPYLEHVKSHTYVDVVAPAGRAVVITGAYTAVELLNINGPVTVSTTHGRIHLIDLTARIDASAREGGSIIFAGSGGHVHLSADLGIDVRISQQNYAGVFEATARGPVRVRLPHRFASGFEANVHSRAEFVCRVELGSPLRFRRDHGRIAVHHGSEDPPRMRLTSLEGPVVIDQSS